MRLRLIFSSLVAVLGALAVMVASAAPAAAAECGNEAIREEQHSTYLAECRGYELVSPSNDIAAHARSRVAVNGERVGWFTTYPPGGTQTGGQYYVSARGPSGWEQPVSAIPPQAAGTVHLFACHPVVYFSPQVSASVLADGYESIGLESSVHPYCEHNEPSLFTQLQAAAMEEAGFKVEPEGEQNLYADALTPVPAAYQEANLTPLAEKATNAFFEDASTGSGDEFTHVLFEENSRLTENAPAGEDLYDWTGGKVHLVTVLPEGEPVLGALANGAIIVNEGDPKSEQGSASYTGAMSSDGSRVFFEAEGQLYLRQNPEGPQSTLEGAECVSQTVQACTVQVDAPAGGGKFLAATPTGTEVFFVDQASKELTGDTEAGSGANLYEYQVDSGTLTDLTANTADAEVLGYSGLGESEGHPYLYFVARGKLTGANPEGNEPVEGEPNLYLSEGAGTSLRFVATLDGTATTIDGLDWGIGYRLNELRARVSENGRFLAFGSVNELTGYDNRPAEPGDCKGGEGCGEIFVYDAATEALACASCGQAGIAPIGSTTLGRPTQLPVYGANYQQRQLTNDGAVFFESPDELLRGDINQTEDVYEYSAGTLSLISSGTSPYPSHFAEATASGSDVLFTTSQPLLTSDVGGNESLYDARIGGGFVEPSRPAEPCASGAECHAGPGAPAFSAPASVSFTGLGDLKPPPAKEAKSTTRKSGGKKQGKAAKRRRQKLHRALKRCKRRYRHNRHKRRACKHRARKRFGARAKGARRHRRGRHGRHRRHHGRRHHHRGGAR